MKKLLLALTLTTALTGILHAQEPEQPDTQFLGIQVGEGILSSVITRNASQGEYYLPFGLTYNWHAADRLDLVAHFDFILLNGLAVKTDKKFTGDLLESGLGAKYNLTGTGFSGLKAGALAYGQFLSGHWTDDLMTAVPRTNLGLEGEVGWDQILGGGWLSISHFARVDGLKGWQWSPMNWNLTVGFHF